jgi:hypothetical protein
VAPGQSLTCGGLPLGSRAVTNRGAIIIAAAWEDEAADGSEEEEADRLEKEAAGGGGEGGSMLAGAEMGRPGLRKQIHAGGGRRGHRRSGSTPLLLRLNAPTLLLLPRGSARVGGRRWRSCAKGRAMASPRGRDRVGPGAHGGEREGETAECECERRGGDGGVREWERECEREEKERGRLGCSTPRNERRESSTAFCSALCSIRWSVNMSPPICISRMQQRLQKPLETVLGTLFFSKNR